MADLFSYVGKIINGGAIFGVLYFQNRERDKDLFNLWNGPATVRMGLLPTSIRYKVKMSRILNVPYR